MGWQGKLYVVMCIAAPFLPANVALPCLASLHPCISPSFPRSARYLRCTTTTLPATRDLSTQLGLPLAILCTPFAACDQEDLPTISSEPMRCAKCKGFLNPQALLSEGKWVCNLCGMSNVLPER